MKIRLELGTLGIISNQQKCALECYVDTRLFRQRKTYDEYYVDTTNYDVDIELGDMMILGELFKVIVLYDAVIITDLD